MLLKKQAFRMAEPSEGQEVDLADSFVRFSKPGDHRTRCLETALSGISFEMMDLQTLQDGWN
jgi:hypothetical protein